MVDMVLSGLPGVCAEVAQPLSQTKEIKIISAGDGEIGAAKLVGEVMEIISKMPQLIETMTVLTSTTRICTAAAPGAASGSRALSVVSFPLDPLSPEIQATKNQPKFIVRTSGGSATSSRPVVLAPPGTFSVTSSRPAPVTVTSSAVAASPGTLSETSSRSVPVTSSGRLVSVAPPINGTAAQRLPTPQLANPVSGSPSTPHPVVQIPVQQSTVSSALTNASTGRPASRPTGSVLPTGSGLPTGSVSGPTRPTVRSPVSVVLRLPPQKTMRSVGTNTMMSLVSAKDVTVHAGPGRSGLDHGALVVDIAGFKPRQVAITCLDDIAFLVTYANPDAEFVDYQECIRKISHEVAEFVFKNKINAVDVMPLRILP